MKNWEEDDGTEYCTAKEDFADAQAVADKLGITLHGANFAAEYWDNVFEHFLAEYRPVAPPTPTSCAIGKSNSRHFSTTPCCWKRTISLPDTTRAAVNRMARARCLKGVDANKDQSYFLHAVGHAELEKTLFPLGEMVKPEVRRLALEYGLATARKKDSTGICFIGERRFKDFLQQYLPAQPGEIRSLDGAVLGTHQGLMYHTIGQRQGLGIGGLAQREEAPWYVVEKDLARNVLLVAQGNDHPALFKSSLYAAQIYWVAGVPPQLPLHCAAKVRYRQQDQSCTLSHSTEQGYRVDFEIPQRAITPGQSVVFYQGECCLGGGVIERTGS